MVMLWMNVGEEEVGGLERGMRPSPDMSRAIWRVSVFVLYVIIVLVNCFSLVYIIYYKII